MNCKQGLCGRGTLGWECDSKMPHIEQRKHEVILAIASRSDMPSCASQPSR
jgi:hypothetical protein